MICSQCKNEKWDRDICPVCGLSEKDSLLLKADNLKAEGKNLSASEVYQKYLQLNPGDLNALKKRATVLCLDTISTFEGHKFDHANDALLQTLEKDWFWERGHELRIDLYSRFGELEKLAEEYKKFGMKDETRKPSCDRWIVTIQLTKKYSENLPTIDTTLPQEDDFLVNLKSYWMVLLLPFLLWGIFKVPFFSKAEGENGFYKTIFFMIVLGVLILATFAFVIAANRRKRAGKNAKN